MPTNSKEARRQIRLAGEKFILELRRYKYKTGLGGTKRVLLMTHTEELIDKLRAEEKRQTTR